MCLVLFWDCPFKIPTSAGQVKKRGGEIGKAFPFNGEMQIREGG
jgi:hypothetical protein